jgi:hypothetical protein
MGGSRGLAAGGSRGLAAGGSRGLAAGGGAAGRETGGRGDRWWRTVGDRACVVGGVLAEEEGLLVRLDLTEARAATRLDVLNGYPGDLRVETANTDSTPQPRSRLAGGVLVIAKDQSR